MIQQKVIRRSGRVAAVLGILIGCAFAGTADAGEPITAPVGSVELPMNGGFFPKTLSRTVPTPIGLSISGQVKTSEGTRLPPLRELIFEFDRNGAIDVAGLPVCKRPLQTQGFGDVKESCKGGIIGKGSVSIVTEFPETASLQVEGELLIINGGVRGGVTTLYAYTYVTVPTPGAIVSTVKIKKIHKGRLGTEAIVSIPEIGNGYMAVSSFNATIHKWVTYKGKKVNVLTLKCPDGRILGRGEGVFDDGTRAVTEVTRVCRSER